MNEGGL
jgi:hypothetical protein